jgi:hypothetical protein
MDDVNIYGLVPAYLSRPASVPLVRGLFRPSQRIGDITPQDARTVKAIALRVIGSAVPGRPPSVCKLVPSALEFVSGEIWSGDGSLSYTGASAFSAV